MTRPRISSDLLRSARLVLLGLSCCFACAARIDSKGRPAGSSPGGGSAGASGGSAGSIAAAGTNAGASAGTTNAGTGNAGAASAGSTNAGASAGGATSGSGSTDGGDAGEAGASGIAASFPECRTDQDCEIAKDCCACQAVPQGATMPACALACAGNACDAKGLTAEAKCTLGRCTLATSCDQRRARCKSLPPSCPAGEAVSVTELGCWGPCIAATECSEVTDCDACGDAQCVKFPNIGGTTIRCVARQAGCEAGSSCQCLAPCGNFGCAEQNGAVSCFCAGC